MFKSLAKVTFNAQALKALTPVLNASFGVHVSAEGKGDRNAQIAEKLKPERQRLIGHTMYKSINSAKALKIFMEHHIYAVWDFMSLLKALQNHFYNSSVPWVPKPNADIRKFLNEINLVEETDSYALGTSGQQHSSHYEMYIDAMRQCGADPKIAENLVAEINKKPGSKVTEILKTLDLPASVKEFTGYNFSLIEEGKPHKICSAFTFGREDIIPDMFTTIVLNIQKNFPDTNLDKLVYYLQRHIEVDGDTHGPMALDLMKFLCGEDEQKWQEVEDVAIQSIRKRYVLWTGCEEHIKRECK